MAKSLTISNQVSATLNYLVAVHNTILSNVDECKHMHAIFPSMFFIQPHLKEPLDDLYESFTECWKTVVKHRNTSSLIDPILTRQDEPIVSCLFKQDEMSLDAMQKSIDFFLGWWSHPYIGGNLILDYIGVNTMKCIYLRVKEYLDEHYETYEKNCRLEIIYDELKLFPHLCELESRDYVILPKGLLPDFRFEEAAMNPELMNLLIRLITHFD